jgi:hypothetical protein
VFKGDYASVSVTGLSLRIIDQVAEVQGWSVRATESESGGARVEVRI